MLLVCKLYLGKLVFITCHYTRYKWQWKIGKHRAHIASNQWRIQTPVAWHVAVYEIRF